MNESRGVPVPKVRVVLIGGTADHPNREYSFELPEIRIGRPDPGNPRETPDLNLSADRQVSRDHGLLWWDNGRWMVEDTGSRHGTIVSGVDIRGEAARELPYGAPVQMGGTIWTIVPEEWWVVRFGSVIATGLCASVVNYALFHCGLPIVRNLDLSNIGESAVPSQIWRLQIPGYSMPCEFRVPALTPGQTAQVQIPHLPFDTTVLRGLVEPARAMLRLETDDSQPRRAERDLVILGFWDWSYEPSARRTVSAFVTPRNPAVERIVQEAQYDPSHEWNGARTFRDLMRAVADNPEELVLKSIYEYLATRRRIHYEDPKLKIGFAKDAFQSIRAPHRIFPGGSTAMEGRATCIDLALLFCGCLENAGLCPVVIFFGHRGGMPRHAIAGCWAGATPGSKPVSEDKTWLIREVEAKRLYVVECLGTVSAFSPQGRVLSYEEAKRRAVDQIRTANWISIVDVAALRPPYGNVTPIESPYEPEVARIYDEARGLAIRIGSPHVETSHLFCAFFYAGSELSRKLLTVLNVDAAALRRRIDQQQERQTGIPGTSPTQNYLECQQLAEKFARDEGSPSVREQDVIWSVLQKSHYSAKLQATSRSLGIDLEQLRIALSDEHPSPMLASTGAYPSQY